MMDESKPKVTYKLYAMPLNAGNIEIAAKQRFSRATPAPAPGYVLIYTTGRKPAGSEEITEERVELLTQADKQWLFDSNAAIIAEEVEKHKPEMLTGLSEQIAALEAELRRRKTEIDTEGEKASG